MTESKRPNILIIMTDQQRADCIGGHSGPSAHPVLQTPNLDRLAEEGVRFERAYTVSPLCMPARSSFLSGVYPHNHNIWYNAGLIPKEDETLFQHLKKAGYYTGHVGKGHYFNLQKRDVRDWEPYMRARGFDFVHEVAADYISGFVKNVTGPVDLVPCSSRYSAYLEERGLIEVHREDLKRRAREGDFAVWPTALPEDAYMDSYIGAQGAKFLESYDRAEPFCLFVGFHGPHYPWDAPKRFADLYDPEKVPLPKPAEPIPEGSGPWVADLIRSGRFPDDVSPDTVRKAIASYYGKVTLIDEWVGRLIDTLEMRGFRENTVVIFTSDHGEMAGDHQRLNKRVFYEESARIPLIVSIPGATTAGSGCNALVDNLDIFPTLLEIGGCPPSNRCRALSLLPLLSDPRLTLKGEVFSEVARETNSGRFTRTTMVRTDRYKYAVDDLGRGFMLFDMAEDPQENNNLVGNPNCRDVEADMQGRLLNFMLNTQYEQHFPGARRK